MKEGTRNSRYRESPDERRALDEMNRLLADVEKKLESQAVATKWPLVFVIGAPRSGTTLTSQILISTGAYAWVTNFIARFWEAPALGAKIAHALGVTDKEFRSSFDSEFGTTRGWLEPHEFGYFWNRFFDLGQPTHKLTEQELARVDASGLQRAIERLQAEFDAPLILKNNTWCTFQVSFLARLFPHAVFVACFRDEILLAQSLLLARRERLEDPTEWWSVRPPTYAELRRLPEIEQVLRQARDIQTELERELRAIAPTRVVRVDYAELCRDPAALCRCTAAAAGVDAGDLERIPDGFEPRESSRLPAGEWSTLHKLANS